MSVSYAEVVVNGRKTNIDELRSAFGAKLDIDFLGRDVRI